VVLLGLVLARQGDRTDTLAADTLADATLADATDPIELGEICPDEMAICSSDCSWDRSRTAGPGSIAG
jgi:hypothetical protein